jgi:hypothetical protein
MRYLLVALSLVSVLAGPAFSGQPAAAVTPPIAYWVPFEVTTPAGSKASWSWSRRRSRASLS